MDKKLFRSLIKDYLKIGAVTGVISFVAGGALGIFKEIVKQNKDK